MGDYVERDKVIREMEWYIERCPDCAECLEARKRIIAHIPSADVRPVVLCRDCRHWDTDWTPTHARKNEHFCPNIGLTTREDWFCDDGEKREES